jgi:hypothetical protein
MKTVTTNQIAYIEASLGKWTIGHPAVKTARGRTALVSDCDFREADRGDDLRQSINQTGKPEIFFVSPSNFPPPLSEEFKLAGPFFPFFLSVHCRKVGFCTEITATDEANTIGFSLDESPGPAADYLTQLLRQKNPDEIMLVNCNPNITGQFDALFAIPIMFALGKMAYKSLFSDRSFGNNENRAKNLCALYFQHQFIKLISLKRRNYLIKLTQALRKINIFPIHDEQVGLYRDYFSHRKYELNLFGYQESFIKRLETKITAAEKELPMDQTAAVKNQIYRLFD